MWFGTINGLNRFDGIQFSVYKRKEGGLPGNYIIGINQSPDGWLWISTHKGICRCNSSTEVFEPLALPNNTDERGDNDFVSGIVFDGKGFGWFTTPDHLYRIHLQTMELTGYPPVSQDLHPLLMYLYMDSRGQLWGLRGGALYRFDPQTRQYIYTLGQDSQHRESQLHVSTLYEDSHKQLWATTVEQGLFRYDSQQQCFVDEPDGNTTVHTIVEDWLPDGQPFFWAGNANQVLSTYDPATHQYTSYKHDSRDELSHNGGGIVQLYRDPQNGIVWMATTSGIQKKDPFEIKFKRKLIPVPPDNGHNTQVRFIRTDLTKFGQYWIGLSEEGLLRWNRPTNTFTKIHPKPRLASWNVYDLLQEKNGRMWMGSDNALIHWDPANDQWEYKRDFFITPKAYQLVTALLEDGSGQIWIGSSHDGLFVMNSETGSIKPWPLVDNIGVGNPLSVYKLATDQLNRIWVSTNRGVFRIDVAASQTKQIQLHPLSKQILPSDRLQSTLFIDSQNRLWVSGIGFLAQADLDGKVSKIYTQENALQADHIFSIAEDQSGRFWMTTDNLIHRLDIQTGTFAYFRKENGLYANNSDSQISKDATGELFIGFTGAFNHFIPEKLLYNTQVPAAVLT
jgi:ligand-binding sensor domain-containing protein